MPQPRVTFHITTNSTNMITMTIRKDEHELGMWLIEPKEASRMFDELDKVLGINVPDEYGGHASDCMYPGSLRRTCNCGGI